MQTPREMAEEAAACLKEGNKDGYRAWRQELLLRGFDPRTVDRWLVDAGAPVESLYPSINTAQPSAGAAV